MSPTITSFYPSPSSSCYPSSSSEPPPSPIPSLLYSEGDNDEADEVFSPTEIVLPALHGHRPSAFHHSRFDSCDSNAASFASTNESSRVSLYPCSLSAVCMEPGLPTARVSSARSNLRPAPETKEVSQWDSDTDEGEDNTWRPLSLPPISRRRLKRTGIPASPVEGTATPQRTKRTISHALQLSIPSLDKATESSDSDETETPEKGFKPTEEYIYQADRRRYDASPRHRATVSASNTPVPRPLTPTVSPVTHPLPFEPSRSDLALSIPPRSGAPSPHVRVKRARAYQHAFATAPAPAAPTPLQPLTPVASRSSGTTHPYQKSLPPVPDSARSATFRLGYAYTSPASPGGLAGYPVRATFAATTPRIPLLPLPPLPARNDNHKHTPGKHKCCFLELDMDDREDTPRPRGQFVIPFPWLGRRRGAA